MSGTIVDIIVQLRQLATELDREGDLLANTDNPETGLRLYEIVMRLRALTDNLSDHDAKAHINS